MLDPIFDLLAGMLAWFYSIVPSYGFAIIMLTVVVLIVFAPLTYKSTKSMVAMRRLQPSVKRIQKKHAGDRETMNQEMMALYQEHNVSPLSGCLPILIQSPVFLALFRVIRGITRRFSTIGFRPGELVVAKVEEKSNYIPAELPKRNFNPEYLNQTSDLYQALIDDNKMLWLGIDLSRTPMAVLRDSLVDSLPYLLMVVLVAGLSWYQQRQIAGRSSGEISSQQQLIMKILPWMLPVFSFTMPAGLVLYFIVSALLRVAQQAYITRRVYGDEELTAPLELDDDEDEDDDEDGSEPESPLAALFGGTKNAGSSGPSTRHGSRRPTSSTASARKRTRPPRDLEPTTSAKTKAKTKKPTASSNSDAKSTPSGWGRAKRSAPKSQTPEKPVSRRVTQKRHIEPRPNNRRKKK